jgi:hypothetical protein
MATRRRPAPVMTRETWTWQQAEEALTHRQPTKIRLLRSNDIDKYARDMKKKDSHGHPMWDNCSQPIEFDWDGFLINGQHRCHAQVKSKTKQTWWVLRGVDPSTARHIDTGIPRSASDQLKAEEHQNVVVLAGVARWAFLLENGSVASGRVKPSNEEIIDMVDRHPDLQHSAYMGQFARTGFVRLNPTPAGAAHWWIAQSNDHAEADVFIERMVRMSEPDGSPIKALMHRFNQARMDGIHVPTREQISAIVRCWNYDVQGKFVKKMAVRSVSGQYKLQKVLVRETPQKVTSIESELDESDAIAEKEAG